MDIKTRYELMANRVNGSKERDDIARIVADIHGVSVSYVQKIRAGERENDAIMETLVEYRQGKKALIEQLYEKTKLIKHIESLIPVEGKEARNG